MKEKNRVEPADEQQTGSASKDDADLSSDPGDGQATTDQRDSADAALNALLQAIAHSPPRTPPSTLAGTLWGADGRYIIGEKLGQGGMGVVYKADDTKLKRPVALKLLGHPSKPLSQSAKARFLAEAQVGAQFKHERIAQVYDAGEYNNTAFVAMEFVDGQTLRHWMRGRTLAVEAVLALGNQIAEGLAALHEKSIFHRDLKPENVMITNAGAVKLVDFGLARWFTEQSLDDTTGRGFTAESTGFSGTLGYMAPEQYAAGRPLDARVDVFALGVILFELVTGTPPFRVRARDQAAASMQQPPDFEGERWRRMPRALRSVAARALLLEPSKRFKNGAELLAALGKVKANRGLTKRAVGAAIFAAAAFGMAFKFYPLSPKEETIVIPTPPGMARVDVGEMLIGREPDDLDAECRAIGPGCERAIMRRETPSARHPIAPFSLDVDEVTNEAMAAWLNTLTGSLRVVDDSDDHYPRYVRKEPPSGRDDDVWLDLSSPGSGIEYTSERTFRVRPGLATSPVVQVTWDGAHAFCVMHGKRLPTEDEWEAAARGKEGRRLPWGDTPARCGDVVVPADGKILMAPGCPESATIAPVGRAPQDITPEGVRGLGGNVSEWVNGTYVKGNRQASSVDSREANLPKVIRGGSFAESAAARTTARIWRPANGVGNNLGFRCALDGQQSKNRK